MLGVLPSLSAKLAVILGSRKHRVLLSSDALFPRPGRSWDTPPHRSGLQEGGLAPAPQALRQGVLQASGDTLPDPGGLGCSGRQCLDCAIRALPECSRTTSGCKALLPQPQLAPRGADGALGSRVPAPQASEQPWGLTLGPPLDSLVSFTPRTRGGGGTQPSYSLFLLANLGDKGGGSPATRKAQDIPSSSVEK